MFIMRWSWLLSVPLLLAPAAAKKEEKDPNAPTTFNGAEVPPMTQLTPDNIEDKLSKGNWLVEFYSPYCHHCTALAPTWQTLYEFYYTSKPIADQTKSETDGLNSFSRYYNYNFAKIDCIAYYDMCEKKGVTGYPTIKYFVEGKEEKKSIGVKKLAVLSLFVEEQLESIKPGSRPREGLRLPEAGDTEVKPNAKLQNPLKIPQKAPEKKPQEVKDALREKPNSFGNTVDLSTDSFDKLVTATGDAWFVKFYAPWCHHCQAMAPNWAEMAREMKGKLNVGRVNCEAERQLCKQAKVHGFPTLLLFRGGERVEYNGLRGVGDLIAYANKAIDVGSGVNDITSEQFTELEKTEEVIFTYFYDHATTSEDFAALDHLTLSLIGHGKLVKTKDPKLAERFKISTWPRLMVSRDGKPSYYPYIAPKDMRDFRQMLKWIRTVWLPLVPELTASNAREVMADAIVVLGVLSRERSDEFIIAKREMKNAALEWIDRETHNRQLERQELRDAKELRIEEAEDRDDERALARARNTRVVLEAKPEVKFAWVDGVFWKRWIKTTYGVDVVDGEKVIIIDDYNRRYWDTTMTGNPIVPSRTSILETLPRILSNPPKIAAKSSSSTLGTIFYTARSFWRRHPWFTSFAFLAALAASFVLGRRARRQPFSGVGWFDADGEKGGFGNGAGKTD